MVLQNKVKIAIMGSNATAIMEIKQEIADSQVPLTSRIEIIDLCDVKSEPSDSQAANQQPIIDLSNDEETGITSKSVCAKEKNIPKVDVPAVHRCTGKISVANYRRRHGIRVVDTPPNERNANDATNSHEMASTSSQIGNATHKHFSYGRSSNMPVGNVTFIQVNPAEVVNHSHGFLMCESSDNTSESDTNQPAPSAANSTSIAANNRLPCSVCNETYSSRQSLQKHMKTQKHSQNLEKEMQKHLLKSLNTTQS